MEVRQCFQAERDKGGKGWRSALFLKAIKGAITMKKLQHVGSYVPDTVILQGPPCAPSTRKGLTHRPIRR